MKVGILLQDVYSLGGIQRVVPTISDYINQNEEDIEIVLITSYQNKSDRVINSKIVNYYEVDKSFSTLIRNKLMRFNELTRFFDKLKLNFILDYIAMKHKAKKKIISIIKNEKFDIVIGAGFWQTVQLYSIRKKLKNVKIIGWMHSTFDGYFNKKSLSYSYINYSKKNFPKLASLFVLSKADKEIFDEKFNMNSQVQYNAYDGNVFYNDEKCDFNNRKNILFVGRISYEQKGLDFLIMLAELFYENKNDIKIIVVGDGPDKDKFITEIKQKKLEQYFDIVGMKDNVQEYYKNAKVLVMPSRYEGFGMVLIEGMACGTPVISFENSGPNEIIKNSHSGYLIYKYDIADFYYKLIKLYYNENTWKMISLNGINRVNFFSEKNVVTDFIRKLKEIENAK